MKKDVEIKFRVNKHIKRKLKGIKLKPYKEIDEYFLTKEMFDGDTYLRFRKKHGKIFLQFKDITLKSHISNDVYKANEASGEIGKKQYMTMKKIFNQIFPIKSKVEKIRH